MIIGAPRVLYKFNPVIILKRAISVTKVGINIPRKNSATITFFILNSNRSKMNAVIVPNMTLKIKLITRIIPVFLNPNKRYLLANTSLKLSKVILESSRKQQW